MWVILSQIKNLYLLYFRSIENMLRSISVDISNWLEMLRLCYLVRSSFAHSLCISRLSVQRDYTPISCLYIYLCRTHQWYKYYILPTRRFCEISFWNSDYMMFETKKINIYFASRIVYLNYSLLEFANKTSSALFKVK